MISLLAACSSFPHFCRFFVLNVSPLVSASHNATMSNGHEFVCARSEAADITRRWPFVPPRKLESQQRESKKRSTCRVSREDDISAQLRENRGSCLYSRRALVICHRRRILRALDARFNLSLAFSRPRRARESTIIHGRSPEDRHVVAKMRRGGLGDARICREREREREREEKRITARRLGE